MEGNHTKTLYDTGGKALQSGHYEGISPLWNPSLAAFLGQQISPKYQTKNSLAPSILHERKRIFQDIMYLKTSLFLPHFN